MFNSSANVYHGSVTCTIKGIICQRWDSNYPHTPSVYSGRSDLGNRCKLATGARPWCYTTDPDTRWDYCPVLDINCGIPPTLSTPSTMVGAEVTIKNPHMSSDVLAWYQCLSLSGDEPIRSCPVTRCESLVWSKANISCSVKDCYDAHNNSYEGQVSCTGLGITCQRWDSNYPHFHHALQGRSDLENWCQMEGESRPWCYTTDPSIRWEFCSVIECP
ncbi:plasminogen-like [Ylistrum balloti]|uniref:plasminogen-like n=1 Tax=Ylistrum balloti TaxID=509963 RepID=UPI002905F217|nr:plasminogen-like [Ylistrum balloti]